MIISAPIFEAYIKCPYKCWQFCLGEKGEENVYLDFIRMQNHAYRTAGLEKLIVKFQGSEYVALRLSRAFDTISELWLNLQRNYDLWHTANETTDWQAISPILKIAQVSA